MKTHFFTFVFLGLFIFLAATPSAQEEPVVSVHALSLEQHRNTAPAFVTFVSTQPLAKSKSVGSSEVIGFYPYWVTQSPWNLPLDVLTTVAFFSIEIDSAGNLTNLHGWPNGTLVNAAHFNGVKVAVTFTNFSSSSIATLVGSSANRTNAIDNIVDQVVSGNADGVNIDFEGVPYSAKANFVLFISELRAELNAAIPGAHLSIDTPAIDWASSFDYDGLAANCDYLMIMAYDYHYKGGDPGPVAPLYAGGIWPSWAGIDYTLNDYQQYIAPYDLGKVVVGLPLYGYNWPSSSSALPGSSTGTASAVLLEDAMAMALDGSYGSVLYDNVTETPYLIYYSGGWRQLFYNDPDSLELRFAYAANRGALGVGFWALGYEGAYTQVWDDVDAYFGTGTIDDDDDATDDDDDDDAGPICGTSYYTFFQGTTNKAR